MPLTLDLPPNPFPLGWEKLPPHLRSSLPPQTLSHLSLFPPDFPDLELLPFANGAPPPSYKNHSPSSNYATFAVGILTPKSRGNVTIKSVDTRDMPVVDPNFLGDEEGIDESLAVQGVKRVREWAEGTGIVVEEVSPGEHVEKDEDIRKWIREVGALVFHGMGTCEFSFWDD